MKHPRLYYHISLFVREQLHPPTRTDDHVERPRYGKLPLGPVHKEVHRVSLSLQRDVGPVGSSASVTIDSGKRHFDRAPCTQRCEGAQLKGVIGGQEVQFVNHPKRIETGGDCKEGASTQCQCREKCSPFKR